MKKILLLDDNPDILQVVEAVLAYENYEVKATSTSANFIQMAEQFCPDLVILDFRLGDGNGGEICRALKAHPTLSPVPVILFTAYVQPGLNLFEFGCDEVIDKPFDLNQLLDIVRQLTTTTLLQG